MNQANVDMLFQVTGPVGPYSTAPRRDSPIRGFEHHLSQAAVPTEDSLPYDARQEESYSEVPRPEQAGQRSDYRDDSWDSPAACQPTGNEDVSDRHDEVPTDVADTAAPQATDESGGEESKAIDEPAEGDDAADSGNEDKAGASTLAAVAGAGGNAAVVVVGAVATHQQGVTTQRAEGKDSAAVEHAAVATENSKGQKANAIASSTQESHAADVAQTTPASGAGEPTLVSKEANTATKTRAQKQAAETNSEVASEDSPPAANKDAAVPAADATIADVELAPADGDGNDGEQASDESGRTNEVVSDASSQDEAGQTASAQSNDPEAKSTKPIASPVANPVVSQPGDRAPVSSTEDGAKPVKAVAAKTAGIIDAAGRLQTGTNGSPAKANGEDLPRVDPARFVGRVAKAFQTAQDRGGTLQIRLSPPELGAMRLELTVKDGVMTASLETENVAAQRTLLEHLPALRDRLAEQNIRVERFDVDVRREDAGGQADPRATRDQQQSPQNPADRRQQTTAQRPAAARPTALPQVILSDTGINLVA